MILKTTRVSSSVVLLFIISLPQKLTAYRVIWHHTPKNIEQTSSSSQTSPQKPSFFKAHLQGFAVAGSFGGLDVCRDTGNSVDRSLLSTTLYLGCSKAGIDLSVGWMDGPAREARFPSHQKKNSMGPNP